MSVNDLDQGSSISRRQALWKFSQGATGMALVASCQDLGGTRSLLGQQEHREAFPYGVASGDPTSDGVVLWTAIHPNIFEPGAELTVKVYDLKNPNSQQSYSVRDFGKHRDLTASIAVRGLNPNRSYGYQFHYKSYNSRLGRARTLPNSSQSIDKLSLAVLTCQDYTTGFYSAFQHLAQNQDVDFVVHVGDFIYEYNKYPEFDSQVIRPIGLPNNFALNLNDYRAVFKTMRSDPDFQDALARHTFIITIDDHEIADNAHFYRPDNVHGIGYYAAAPHPLAVKPGTSMTPEQKEKLAKLKEDAQKAWFEYVPTRDYGSYDLGGIEIKRLFRDFKFGSLGHLFVTDSRSFRDREPCIEGSTFQNKIRCLDYKEKGLTMLGQTQRRWLIDGITESPAEWKIWGNQTLLSQCAIRHKSKPLSGWIRHNTRHPDPFLFLNYDAWDGYQQERSFILNKLYQGGERDLVVLTGDMHISLASDIALDFDQISSKKVGIELMTPAISSPNLEDSIANKVQHLELINELAKLFGYKTIGQGLLEANNEHFKYVDASIYGYAVVSMTSENLSWKVYDIDKLNRPGSPTVRNQYQWNYSKSSKLMTPG